MGSLNGQKASMAQLCYWYKTMRGLLAVNASLGLALCGFSNMLPYTSVFGWREKKGNMAENKVLKV